MMKTEVICSDCGEVLRANYRDPVVNNCGDVERIWLVITPCKCTKAVK